jgi:hypothetical protein
MSDSDEIRRGSDRFRSDLQVGLDLLGKHETFLRRSKSIHNSYETIYSSEIIMTTNMHMEYTLFFNSLLLCDEYKSKES